MTSSRDDADRLAELLDRYGSNLARWPDPDLAHWARRAILADRRARDEFEAARTLDALLSDRAAGFAGDTALADRIVTAVSSAPGERRRETRRWMAALAACFLLAAVFGGALAQIVAPLPDESELELAMLESMLFGPGEGDMP